MSSQSPCNVRTGAWLRPPPCTASPYPPASSCPSSFFCPRPQAPIMALLADQFPARFQNTYVTMRHLLTFFFLSIIHVHSRKRAEKFLSVLSAVSAHLLRVRPSPDAEDRACHPRLSALQVMELGAGHFLEKSFFSTFQRKRPLAFCCMYLKDHFPIKFILIHINTRLNSI